MVNSVTGLKSFLGELEEDQGKATGGHREGQLCASPFPRPSPLCLQNQGGKFLLCGPHAPRPGA